MSTPDSCAQSSEHVSSKPCVPNKDKKWYERDGYIITFAVIIMVDLGPSEFQLLPPQLQHLRNSCLLQYILLVITQMYTHTFMVTRTKV